MKSVVKVVSVAACAALLTGSVAVAAYHLGSRSVLPAASETASPATDTVATANSKDETVYVLAGADGTVRKVIVSDWIKNNMNAATLTDSGALSDVQNVKDDTTYSLNSDGARVWDAQGNDICYQGNIEKELPVTLSVTYLLDGQPVDPAALAGKSGQVTIRYHYTNTQYETVTIDGKPAKIYVPFAMLTGLLLDNDTFTDITVSNGRLINDGDRTAVVGIAFPGLQESLALDAEKLELPDTVEINATVKNFSLGMTVTLATNEVFNQLDTDELSKADDLTDSMNKLTDGMKDLLNGSSSLYGGLCTLLDRSAELAEGIDRLSTGLSTLSEKNSLLNGGASQVFDSLLTVANGQLQEAGLDELDISVPTLTRDNWQNVLTTLTDALTADKVRVLVQNKVNAGIAAQADTVYATYIASLGDSVYQAYLQQQANNLYQQAVAEQIVSAQVAGGVPATQAQEYLTTPEGMQQVAQGVANLSDDQKQQILNTAFSSLTDEQKSQIRAGAVANLTDEEKAQIRAGAAAQMMASADIQAQLAAAEAGRVALAGLLQQLTDYNTFYTGLLAYTAGVQEAADGAAQLKDGIPALTSGITALRDGSLQLSDGLKQFNEQGIRKLSDAVNGDLNGLLTRLRAVADVSHRYRSFSGLSDDMDGQVRFVYRTDEINTK